jgi:putative redox protein
MATEAAESAKAGEAVVVDLTGVGRFQVEARAGTSALLVDEPREAGGLGSGPNPFDLLSAALGACTVMTMRLYAERKGWPLTHARARVAHHRGALQARDTFSLEIDLEGDLDETQRARLIDVASRCPVHQTLDRGADMSTTLLPVGRPVPDTTKVLCEHMKTMEEACEDRA